MTMLVITYAQRLLLGGFTDHTCNLFNVDADVTQATCIHFK